LELHGNWADEEDEAVNRIRAATEARGGDVKELGLDELEPEAEEEEPPEAESESSEEQRGGERTTCSAKAGLQFPVGRIHRLFRNGNHAKRVGAGASVYLAAVLEYVTAEVLTLAGDAARDEGTRGICPRQIQIAIRKDEKLRKLLASVTISQTRAR
ncbi:imidazoleglycerol-phosphate dehydratase, partial [Tilletia horrida]